jgi:hypothetical protein
MPLTVGLGYDDFLRLLFLYAHREGSDAGNDIPEEPVTFVFFTLNV